MNIIDKIREELESAKNLIDADEMRASINTALNHTDDAIDHWLVKWAGSQWSMAIAVGFGVTLLVIGYMLGKVV